MDGNRFDELARHLAAPTTRRNALRSFIGGVAVVAGLSRRHDALAICPDDAECSVDIQCATGDPCVIGQCAGCSCTYIDAPNGTNCEDGNLCTQGDTCQAGSCVSGAPVTCPPLSPCLQGVCNPATGICAPQPRPTGYPCDDGNRCTINDICFNGTCVGGTPVICQPPDNCHVAGTCNPSTGTCSNPPRADGSPCNDGTVCNGSETCQGGVCTAGEPLTCTTTNPCMVSSCDSVAGCVETPKPSGTACGDSNACNGNETCDGAGNCVAGTPVTCGECQICDATSGTCGADASQDGTSCTGDGNRCFGGHVCQSGSCVGTNPATCSALDQCHDAGTCSPSTGLCSNPVKSDGAACSDGNGCTTGDTCHAGVCTGGDLVTCPPVSEVCKVSAGCNSTTGLCGVANAPDGTACSGNGGCVNGSCLTCGKNEEFCGGVCRAKNSYGKDERNCGACGHVCPPNYICKGSFCTPLR